MTLFAFTVRRTLAAAPMVIVMIVVNFLLLKAVPGDLVDVMAGESGIATAEQMADLRARFGLDRSALDQFQAYLSQLLRFDLGFSFRYNRPIADLVLERLPATALLVTVAVLAAVAVGVAAGVLAGRRPGGRFDRAVSVLSSLIFAVPSFWIGLVGIVLFAVHLRWLPIGGYATVGAAGAGWPHALDVAAHLVLPAATLGLGYAALYARVTRAAVIETSRLDFVRTARAKGISETRVTLRHILRNALLPVVTLSGLKLGSMLGGAVVVETVFSWPGLGRLAFEAVADRDVNLLLSLFLCNSLLVIVMGILVDVSYAALDPRIEVTA
ncbi:peptide/nickel transport system permease protein [Azospirillum brasilense]|uniref:Peptide/nickel transport system permease protein n=1 Tax=Azospirillum brasilense TaxID=192 RepID=A0A560AU83_AZOBR|nr:ABC transporter permease [Azospirillum brasilense]TWA63916.1 peptide/nickel transport system permease protein [Azospirillum brasilense]